MVKRLLKPWSVTIYSIRKKSQQNFYVFHFCGFRFKLFIFLYPKIN